MTRTTKTERLAFLGILSCLLINGYLDQKDADMAQKYAEAQKAHSYAASQTGRQIACLQCAGGVR